MLTFVEELLLHHMHQHLSFSYIFTKFLLHLSFSCISQSKSNVCEKLLKLIYVSLNSSLSIWTEPRKQEHHLLKLTLLRHPIIVKLTNVVFFFFLFFCSSLFFSVVFFPFAHSNCHSRLIVSVAFSFSFFLYVVECA